MERIMEHEQDALEKLGYKEKPCNFGKIFKKDDGTFIMWMRFTADDTVVEHIQKGNGDCEMTFTSSEILALAEVIKEMENTK